MVVVQVDDEGMGVDQPAVPVRVAVRFGVFPAFVIVVVVLVVNVQVTVVERLMGVLDHGPVPDRPQADGGEGGGCD